VHCSTLSALQPAAHQTDTHTPPTLASSKCSRPAATQTLRRAPLPQQHTVRPFATHTHTAILGSHIAQTPLSASTLARKGCRCRCRCLAPAYRPKKPQAGSQRRCILVASHIAWILVAPAAANHESFINSIGPLSLATSGLSRSSLSPSEVLIYLGHRPLLENHRTSLFVSYPGPQPNRRLPRKQSPPLPRIRPFNLPVCYAIRNPLAISADARL
jgi:hypothetical protein